MFGSTKHITLQSTTKIPECVYETGLMFLNSSAHVELLVKHALYIKGLVIPLYTNNTTIIGVQTTWILSMKNMKNQMTQRFSITTCIINFLCLLVYLVKK